MTPSVELDIDVRDTVLPDAVSGARLALADEAGPTLLVLIRHRF